MSQVHVLNQMTLGIPSANKYSPWLRQHLSMIKEMAEYSEDVEPITGRLWSKNSAWAGVVEGITQHGPGVYSFPYLNPAFCEALLLELGGLDYTVNEEEPVEAQIPEVVLQELCPVLYEVFRAFWFDAAIPLSKLLFGLVPDKLTTVQAAKYTLENTSRGHWHTDQDSDVTLVVALSNDHEGGGTEVYQGPFRDTIVVPQLPVGHAMFFNGKANQHYGLPVTQGERNLLVHWSETK